MSDPQRFWRVQLAPGITRGNMAAFYASCLIGLSAFTFIAAAQSTLLELLGVAEADKGSVSGHIGVAAEIVLIVAVGLYGSLSDRIGRRPVFVLGFVVVAVGLLLAPFAGSVLRTFKIVSSGVSPRNGGRPVSAS